MPPRDWSIGREAWARLTLLTTLVLGLGWPSRARAANDPYLDFWTLETLHFRIHYAKNIEPVAERVADLAESINARLAPILGHEPSQLTHIVLTDNAESANGSATGVPYNAIRLFVTAPDDMSPLIDYEDWLLELVTHEYTHILHIDNVHGLPALVNAILGRTLTPNQLQPRWVLEGLAVLEESKTTAGGRNRSALFDMYLRADVLENRFATLDQISHQPRRWPGGTLWYLYGSRFLTWIVDRYGPETMRFIADDYGHQLIPYGINRSIRRATGHSYEELYDAWTASLRKLYGEQLQAVRAAPGGQREGVRLTFHGRTVSRPRWIPPALRRQPETPEVLYYRDDNHQRTGFYRMPLPSRHQGNHDSALLVRAAGTPTASFDRLGNLYLSNLETHRRVYPFSDLLRVPAGADATSGYGDSARRRLSVGLRALDPDVRPDGRQITYVVNRRGTTFLSVADLTPTGTMGPSRVVVAAERFQVAQTPRYSPNGSWIAYSVWSRHGYRDIRVVDVATGHVVEITHDRANDVQPSWSPDGRTLYFSSDRTGIPNVYAYDFSTGNLWQVTNVATGAFMPEASPDGRSLLYVGYSSAGFDLFALPLDRNNWSPALPYVDNRPAPLPDPLHHAWPRHPYNALETLRPRAWTASYGTGTFGPTVTVSTQGGDAVGLHAVGASVGVSTTEGKPQATISYSYGRLPFDWSTTAFRTLAPNREARVNGVRPLLTEEALGISNYLTFTLPRAFDAVTFQGGYTFTRFDSAVPTGARLDPQAPITLLPSVRGYLGLLRFGISYSNIERYLYSVGPARGLTFQVTTEMGGQATASNYDVMSVGYGLTKFWQMPWHPDHTLVFAMRGAATTGSYPRRNVYYTGGFVDVSPLDAFQNNLFQGGFVLRGYPAGAFGGRQYQLGNVEYRFPLWHPERGLSTLPVFFNRLSGALFLDVGGAFSKLDLSRWQEQFHPGYGAELLIDTTVGYVMGLTGRLGYARGAGPKAYAGGNTYFVLALPY